MAAMLECNAPVYQEPAPPPLRILFVLSYYYPYIGGAEYIFKEVTAGLVRRGHEVKVITTHLADTPLQDVIDGVHVERVQVPLTGDRYFFGLFNVPTLLQQIRDYDVVHTASNNLSYAVGAISRLMQRPVVFTSLEFLGKRWNTVESNPFKRRFFALVEKTMTRFPYHCYTAISQATYTDLVGAGVDPRLATVIYCGIDPVFLNAPHQRTGVLRSVCEIPPDDFLYVYFGRPGWTKGVDYLVKAVPAIQQALSHAHLVLILSQTPPTAYQRICDLVASLGPDLKVHFVPATNDRPLLASYLLDADCVVVPSLTEGFGFTTAETCALGVPIVASRVGSIPEVISGKHLLVEPGSPQAIADAVIRMARGEYAWSDPKDFAWERIVQQYESVYRSLCS
jgi:glycosyltransferase involved in cell wall biosynthesis